MQQQDKNAPVEDIAPDPPAAPGASVGARAAAAGVAGTVEKAGQTVPADTEGEPGVPEGAAEEAAEPELTPEEREAIHARNALIRALDAAFTDVRQRSYEGKLTTTARWRKRPVAPEGMTAKEFEAALLEYLAAHEHAEAKPVMGRVAAPKPLDVELEGQELTEDDPLPEPVVTDIALMQGKKATYLYSVSLLSHSFAKALYHTAEDNDVATFVDVVRTESSTYPRPVGIDSLMNPPYLWSRAHTREVFGKVQEAGSFNDIHEVHASNGVAFYYSDLYLSEAQAKSLAEWAAVERQRNP